MQAVRQGGKHGGREGAVEQLTRGWRRGRWRARRLLPPWPPPPRPGAPGGRNPRRWFEVGWGPRTPPGGEEAATVRWGQAGAWRWLARRLVVGSRLAGEAGACRRPGPWRRAAAAPGGRRSQRPRRPTAQRRGRAGPRGDGRRGWGRCAAAWRWRTAGPRWAAWRVGRGQRRARRRWGAGCPTGAAARPGCPPPCPRGSEGFAPPCRPARCPTRACERREPACGRRGLTGGSLTLGRLKRSASRNTRGPEH